MIRHGESEADLLHVHEGRADFELTRRGHRQAEAMAEYVNDRWRISRIYASPLKRAAQTARHLSQKVGREIRFEEDLMEFNNGLLAGLSFEEADRRYPVVRDLPPDRAVYGQESKVEFRARADRVLKKICAQSGEDEIVAVVTHGGMIQQLYGALMQQPVPSPFVICTGDTGIHVWKLDRGAVYLLNANLTAHTAGI